MENQPLMEHLYCVIMAGGKGERFWPLSTKDIPKPFVRPVGRQDHDPQMTIDRVLELVPKDHVFVVLGADHEQVAQRQLAQLGEDQFIVEPLGRDTAACIGLGATLLYRRDPEGVMIVLPADHYIPDTGAFVKTVSARGRVGKAGGLPRHRGDQPDKAGGRLRLHKGRGEGDRRRRVKLQGRSFRGEAGPGQGALQYLSEGIYYWNSGIFVWRTRAVLDGLKAPYGGPVQRGLKEIDLAMSAGNFQAVTQIFTGFPKVSIDYGLMEKADNVLMVKADFAWDDVGTWGSLRRVMELDENGNYRSGRTICVDTKDCVVCAEGVPVGAMGVANLIIVASPQGVLVCDGRRDQETRQIARMFDEEGG